MGRGLVALGVLVMLVGIAGSIFSFVTPFLDPSNTMFNPAAPAIESALEGPQAADLCEAGETIVTEEGESERGVDGSWGRPVRIFCVDDEGNRREVTANFAQDLIGQAFQGIPAFIGGLGLSVCFTSLIGVGVVFIIIGAVIGRRRAGASVVTVGGVPGAQVYTMQSGSSQFTRVPHSSMSASDLTAKLRELESAKAQGLISDEEYERLRKQILDQMR